MSPVGAISPQFDDNSLPLLCVVACCHLCLAHLHQRHARACAQQQLHDCNCTRDAVQSLLCRRFALREERRQRWRAQLPPPPHWRLCAPCRRRRGGVFDFVDLWRCSLERAWSCKRFFRRRLRDAPKSLETYAFCKSSNVFTSTNHCFRLGSSFGRSSTFGLKSCPTGNGRSMTVKCRPVPGSNSSRKRGGGGGT